MEIEFDFMGQHIRYPDYQVILVAPREDDAKLHDVVVRHGPHDYTQFTGVESLKGHK